ncbi:MAG: hypothetical protein F4X15_17675 [Gemmatimonadetes bacterium]|nr:hypothetical protein [Gemmatimonadota bacterium]
MALLQHEAERVPVVEEDSGVARDHAAPVDAHERLREGDGVAPAVGSREARRAKEGEWLAGERRHARRVDLRALLVRVRLRDDAVDGDLDIPAGVVPVVVRHRQLERFDPEVGELAAVEVHARQVEAVHDVERLKHRHPARPRRHCVEVVALEGGRDRIPPFDFV